MFTSSRERIARKQRTTLRNGEKLIDALRSGPKKSFTTSSGPSPRLSGLRWQNLLSSTTTPKSWEDAFEIGQPGGRSGKSIIGQMFKMMYENKLELPDEERWSPVKPLGNGSYGAAALFKHENLLGSADDYVVVKYTQPSQKEMVPGWKSHISREAAIMMQLNELNNDGILFLREYRYFKDTNRHAYFTEYCPNFDVEILRLAHKAMKRYIPEAFLFYTFYALAKGLVAMENGPFGGYATPHKHIQDAFLIHRDLKPPNTFLGYPLAPSQPFNEADPDYLGSKLKYPHAKIADFGLSELTHYSSDVNIMRNHAAGTPVWYPPEVRTKYIDKNSIWYPFRGTCFNEHGKMIPFGQPVNDKLSHAYTPAGNTFAVGFIMYQLMTLDEPEDMSHFLNRIVNEQELPVPMNPLNPGDIPRRFMNLDLINAQVRAGLGITDAQEKLQYELHGIRRMLIMWLNARYNPVLKKLIEQCMGLIPENRISGKDLLAQLEAMLPYYWQTLQQMLIDDPAEYNRATRAFTTEADLPYMQRGTAAIELDALFWRRIVRGFKWLDLTAGNIRPPMDPNDGKIPLEARQMFANGRKQANNNVVI